MFVSIYRIILFNTLIAFIWDSCVGGLLFYESFVRHRYIYIWNVIVVTMCANVDHYNHNFYWDWVSSTNWLRACVVRLTCFINTTWRDSTVNTLYVVAYMIWSRTSSLQHWATYFRYLSWIIDRIYIKWLYIISTEVLSVIPKTSFVISLWATPCGRYLFFSAPLKLHTVCVRNYGIMQINRRIFSSLCTVLSIRNNEN